MSLPIFVLRPEPGLTSTLVAAFRMGLKPKGIPLASVEPVSWSAPAEQFDGLLIGSANALRHAGKELDKVAHLPVIAVGAATASEAKGAGLSVEVAGSGGLQRVLDDLAEEPRHLLRLAGETHLPLEVPSHIRIATEISYAVKYSALTEGQAKALRSPCLVLLHSGEMATHFAQQCEGFGIEKVQISLAVMAPRIAEMAGNGWESVHIAPRKNDAALLEMAAELCQR